MAHGEGGLSELHCKVPALPYIYHTVPVVVDQANKRQTLDLKSDVAFISTEGKALENGIFSFRISVSKFRNDFEVALVA